MYELKIVALFQPSSKGQFLSNRKKHVIIVFFGLKFPSRVNNEILSAVNKKHWSLFLTMGI